MKSIVLEWLSLSSEAQAAWVQAVFSVVAILIAVAIPAVQHLRDRAHRRLLELREAKALAIMLIPNLTTWIENISAYRRIVDNHLSANFPGSVDWGSIQEALRLGEQGMLLAPKTHLMGAVASDAQSFFYFLAAARQLASGRVKFHQDRDRELSHLSKINDLMERAEKSALKAREAAHKLFS